MAIMPPESYEIIFIFSFTQNRGPRTEDLFFYDESFVSLGELINEQDTMSVLESGNIRLRALEPADAELLFKWENDPDLWLVSNTLVPYSKYIIKQYIKNSHLDIYQTKQLRMMIDLKEGDKAETIGAIDLFDFDAYHQRAGIGILIKEVKDRRKGYATVALNLFIQYCFQTLQLHQVYCNVSSDNDSSLNLFRKQGFVVVGEKKEWLRDGKSWRSEYLLQMINEGKW